MSAKATQREDEINFDIVGVCHDGFWFACILAGHNGPIDRHRNDVLLCDETQHRGSSDAFNHSDKKRVAPDLAAEAGIEFAYGMDGYGRRFFF